MNRLDPSTARTFRAFISYRHADNAEEGRRWAYWLHNELEAYQVPRDLIGKRNSFGEPVPENLYPIFRDEEEMRAGVDLSELIADGLKRSDWLIVLCSPRSAASRYVRREIVQFKLLGKTQHILPVIVEGEPGAAERHRSGSHLDPGFECFPRALRRGVPVPGRKDHRGRALIDWHGRPELLAADLRPKGTREQGYTSAAAYRAALDSRNRLLPKPQQLSTKALRDAERRYAEQLNQQKLKIISGLLGVDLGELTKRDAAARARRLKRVLILIVLVLLIVVGFALWAVYQGMVASSNLASSRYTLSNVESEEHSEPAKALLLASGAVEAVPRFDPLLDAYTRRAEMLALASPRHMKVADHVRVAVFSPRLDKVATVDGGKVQITDLRSGESVRVPSLTEPHATVAAFTIPAFSPDGSHFVAGTDEVSARSWRLRDGHSVPVKTPKVIVRGTLQTEFYFSPNGLSALGWVGVETGDEDGQHVQAAWGTESGAPASTAALRAVFRFGELAWSRNPARNWGAVLLDKQRLQVIDVSTGAPVSPEFGPAAEHAEVVSLALSPDAEWLVTATKGGQNKGYELQLWSARDGKLAEVAPMRSSERLQILDVSLDGKKVLAVPDRGRDPTQLQLWEFGRYSYPLPYRELGALPSPQSFWARSWGKSRLASFCGETGLVAAVSAEAADWTGRGPRVQSAFSIRLGHAETAQELFRSMRSGGGLVAWTVSPNGREIATVTADGVVTVTDLFWQEPITSSVATPVAGDSRALRADRAWFNASLSSAITATFEGIRYVGGMPTSEGTPKLVAQHWRLPELKRLWAQPVEIIGDPMKLASAIAAFSPDGKHLAIGASDVRLFDTGSGGLWGKPFAVKGRLLGVIFTSDGERIVLASEDVNDRGKTFTRIEQRKLDSGEEVKDATVEWLRYGEGSSQSDFAGFTADTRHFLRVSAGDRFTGDWSTVEQLELLDLKNSRKLQIRFSRESPAPPALIAAVMQSASGFEPVTSDEVIARLPAARIRIRAVPAGATLRHVESRRSIIAPAGRFDGTLTARLSADARWIATVAPGRREIRVWSTFTGMPSSEPLVRRTELVAMAFDQDAQYLWQIGRDGGPQATYMGTKRPGKPRWLARAGEALTSRRLTGEGVGIEWLENIQLRAAREELLRSLLNDAANGDAGAARIKERLESMLGKQ
jgi:WD40 repeat protein